MIVEFEIAGLPKMTNTSRVHWTKKMREAKKWKELVQGEVHNYLARKVFLSQFGGEFPFSALSKANITLTRYSSVEPDFDGLVSSFKHVIDGLKVAGVIIDDKASVIGQPKYLWEKAKPRMGKIKVRVESVP